MDAMIKRELEFKSTVYDLLMIMSEHLQKDLPEHLDQMIDEDMDRLYWIIREDQKRVKELEG